MGNRLSGLQPKLRATGAMLFAIIMGHCTAPGLEKDPNREESPTEASGGGGGETGDCFCPTLGEPGLELESVLQCLCSELGCPKSVGAATKPFHYWSKLTLECGGATEVAYNGVWSQWLFSFDEQGTLTGASFETDYPAYCGAIRIYAGEFLHEHRDGCTAEWCMITDGLREADEGECLEPESMSTGGFGGSSAAPGGGAGSPPIDK